MYHQGPMALKHPPVIVNGVPLRGEPALLTQSPTSPYDDPVPDARKMKLLVKPSR